MADPGFPIGERGPRRGGVDSRGGYILKILYDKTKEFGALGGVRPACPLDPPMVTEEFSFLFFLISDRTALLQTKEMNRKSPCRELRMTKII